MEWQVILALVIVIPVILIPVLLVWFLNVGGMYAATWLPSEGRYINW
ncbi:hypothetical protein ACFLV3_03460 [Chloroflexota bacterium]